MGCLLIANEVILIFSYDVGRADATELLINDEYTVGRFYTASWASHAKSTKFDVVARTGINDELAISRDSASTKYAIRK